MQIDNNQQINFSYNVKQNNNITLRKKEICPTDISRMSVFEEIKNIDEDIKRAEKLLSSNIESFSNPSRYRINSLYFQLAKNHFDKAKKILQLCDDLQNSDFINEINKVLEYAKKVEKEYYQYPEAQYIMTEALILSGKYDDAAKVCIDLIDNLKDTKFRAKLNIPFWRVNGYKARAFTLLGRSLAMGQSNNKEEQKKAFQNALDCFRYSYFDAQLNAEAKTGLGEVLLESCRQNWDKNIQSLAEKHFLEAITSGGAIEIENLDNLISNLSKTYTIQVKENKANIVSRKLIEEIFGKDDDSWKQFFYDGSLNNAISEKRIKDILYNISVGIFSNYEYLKEDLIEFKSNAVDLIKNSSIPDNKKVALLKIIDANNPIFIKKEKLLQIIKEHKTDFSSIHNLFDNPYSSLLKFSYDALDKIKKMSIPDQLKSRLIEFIENSNKNVEINIVQQLAIKNKVDEDLLIRNVINLADNLIMLSEKTTDENKAKEAISKAQKLLDFVFHYPFIKEKKMLYSRAITQQINLELALVNLLENNPTALNHLKKAFILSSYLQEFAQNSSQINLKQKNQILKSAYENYVRILKTLLQMNITDPTSDLLIEQILKPSFTYQSFEKIMERNQYISMCEQLERDGLISKVEDPNIESIISERIYIIKGDLTKAFSDKNSFELSSIVDNLKSIFTIDNSDMNAFTSNLLNNLCALSINQEEKDYYIKIMADIKMQSLKNDFIKNIEPNEKDFYNWFTTINEIKNTIGNEKKNPWLKINYIFTLAEFAVKLADSNLTMEFIISNKEYIKNLFGINFDNFNGKIDPESTKITILKVCKDNLISTLKDLLISNETISKESFEMNEFFQENNKNANAFAINYLLLSKVLQKTFEISKNVDFLNEAKTFALSATQIANIDNNLTSLAMISYARCICSEITAILSDGKIPEALQILYKNFIFKKNDSETVNVFCAPRNSSEKQINFMLPTNSLDTIDIHLNIANVLMAKTYPENENDNLETSNIDLNKGSTVREIVSLMINKAEKLILEKYPNVETAPKHIRNQLADIAALRVYILMGETPKGEPINLDQVYNNISHAIENDGSTKILVKTSDEQSFEVTDEFMQQKLKLALMNVWIRNGKMNKEISTKWANEIIQSGKFEKFVKDADKILNLYK